jgi:voltage-gated potassium channel
MAVLGLLWLGLFIADVVRGLDPLLTGLSTVIWALFIGDFVLRLLLAPDRGAYLRRSWLTVLSLLIPALRVARLGPALRALRAARAVRGVRLVRAVAALNRGLGALGATLRRRGAWYVAAIVAAVVFAGAAGMYALEPHESGGRGFSGYGDALWWTAMIVTTLGSAYWPQTAEGRVLAFLISLVSIGVFGYVTATLASFFVGREAVGDDQIATGTELRAVRRELAALRREVQTLSARATAAGTSTGADVPAEGGHGADDQ